MANAINWFEIPANNYDRAIQFYSTVLGAPLHKQEIQGTKMAFLPMEGQGVGGAVCFGEGYTPSDAGALIYLNGGDDLAAPLARVGAAGGQVVVPKTKISEEIGYFAVFMDTEGNKMAFHSPS